MRNSSSDLDQKNKDDGGGCTTMTTIMTDGGEKKSTVKMVREYINPAVYVETAYDMRKTDYIPGSGDHPKTVKRCVCFTSPKQCPCHPYVYEEDKEDESRERRGDDDDDDDNYDASSVRVIKSPPPSLLSKNGIKINRQQSSPVLESDSGITVKASSSTCDLRLSISSLSNLSTVRHVDHQVREENYRLWCLKKDHERKMQEEKEALISKVKEQQREAQMELERENFKRWLNMKKQEETEKRKRQAEFEMQERLKLEEQERRMADNEENFQNWLKRKEEKLSEKKSKEQIDVSRQEEQRKQRLEYSRKAYELWLKQSKNKQKPVPFSRGLDTLKSSASVAYINPVPWVPNIERKPNSQ